MTAAVTPAEIATVTVMVDGRCQWDRGQVPMSIELWMGTAHRWQERREVVDTGREGICIGVGIEIGMDVDMGLGVGIGIG
jgi:hypothetical protein